MAMKVTIVGGAGTVGSCAAYRIAREEAVTEIVLVDSRHNVCQAHAQDIEQAMACRTGIRVRPGEITDTADSDIIIMAVGVWGRPTVASRSLQLETDMKLLLGLMPPLVAHSPSAFWIIVTAPVDVLAYWVHRTFSIPRDRVIGFNQNDTIRLRWAVAGVLSVPATAVEAFVLGEHGETQVPIFSRVKIRGEWVTLDEGEKKEVLRRIGAYLTEWNRLQSGRTAGWTTAEALGDMVHSYAAEDGAVFACSSVLEGEYGLKDVSLGVPVRLGRPGVREIIEFELDSRENDGLMASADRIREQISKGQSFYQDSVEAMERLLISLKGGIRS
jgi:malate dehydrogenase